MPDLEDFSADDLLLELRAREEEAGTEDEREVPIRRGR